MAGNHYFNNHHGNNDHSNGNHWENWFGPPNQTKKTRPDSSSADNPFETSPPLSHTPIKIKMEEMINEFNMHCIQQRQPHLLINRHPNQFLQSFQMSRNSTLNYFNRGPNNENVGHTLHSRCITNCLNSWKIEQRPDISDPHKRVYVIYNNFMFNKKIDPMSNHRIGCKCPLHHIIEGVSVPLQQRNNQQRYPQSQTQPLQHIRLTQTQRTFLSESVFKKQWIRLQLEETEELQRYEVFTISPWQKQKIAAIHDIGKRLLETYQISLTHYIVIQQIKKTPLNYNTTCGPSLRMQPRSTMQAQEQILAQAMAQARVQAKAKALLLAQAQAQKQAQARTQANTQGQTQVRAQANTKAQVQARAQVNTQAQVYEEAKKEPVPPQVPKIKPESKQPLRNYAFTPDGEPLYSYYEAGQTMPIRSGGLLNVRPARFLQNNNGFTNISNAPVLENMNRNYVRQMINTNNVDSGGSLSPATNIGTEGLTRNGVNAGNVESGGNDVYASTIRVDGYSDNAGVQNTEVHAMDEQNIESHTTDVENAVNQSRSPMFTRRVVLNAMQQANFNSYRSRKNWLRPPFGSVPYLVQRRHSESDKSSPYGKDRDGFKRPRSPPFARPPSPPLIPLHTPPFVVSTADQNGGDNPHIPTMDTGCASSHEVPKLGNSTQKKLSYNVIRRPNPPYVYPRPPPPYPTELYAQYMQSTQQHSQPTIQHPQPDQKYIQPRQQYSHPMEQNPQLGQEYPQPTQQQTQTCEQFTQTAQMYLPTTHHCPQSTHQYIETTQQYKRPEEQYVQSTQQYTEFAQKYVLPAELYGQLAQGTISATTYYV